MSNLVGVKMGTQIIYKTMTYLFYYCGIEKMCCKGTKKESLWSPRRTKEDFTK